MTKKATIRKKKEKANQLAPWTYTEKKRFFLVALRELFVTSILLALRQTI